MAPWFSISSGFLGLQLLNKNFQAFFVLSSSKIKDLKGSSWTSLLDGGLYMAGWRMCTLSTMWHRVDRCKRGHLETDILSVTFVTPEKGGSEKTMLISTSKIPLKHKTPSVIAFLSQQLGEFSLRSRCNLGLLNHVLLLENSFQPFSWWVVEF